MNLSNVQIFTYWQNTHVNINLFGTNSKHERLYFETGITEIFLNIFL